MIKTYLIILLILVLIIAGAVFIFLKTRGENSTPTETNQQTKTFNIQPNGAECVKENWESYPCEKEEWEKRHPDVLTGIAKLSEKSDSILTTSEGKNYILLWGNKNFNIVAKEKKIKTGDNITVRGNIVTKNNTDYISVILVVAINSSEK